jgi:predicted aspartyl protease
LKRTWKILSSVVLWAVIGSVQTLAQGQATASVNRSGAGTPRILLPVRIYRDFLVVAEGQIGGAIQPRNFVVDTGTAPSIVSASLARELGLATAESTITAVGTLIPTRAATLPEVDLGPIRVFALPVQVQDLSRLEHDLGISVAGIIGLDALSKVSFRLDYKAKEIQFGEVSDAGIPVPFDSRVGMAIALVRVHGKPMRMVVDTGSEKVVLFGGNATWADTFGLRNTSVAASNVGEHLLRVQELLAPLLELGGERFVVEKAYLVPGSSDPRFDGLLGVRALGFRGIAYDQPHQQVYLQK